MHKYFIHKKVTTIVTFLLVLLFGFISLSKLKMDLLPDISFPTLTVITVYSNVAPSEVETLVTRPIEEMVSSVSGVDRISSESIEGVSIITVRFRWGTDMDQASIQTREKVDLVKGNLPQDVKKSIVIRFDPNNAPIMQIAVEPIGVPLKDIRFFLKKNVLPYFERVDGIAAISISGGLERQIQVQVERAKLQGYNVEISEIVNQLDAGNFNFPAGNIKHGDKEVLVRTNGAFKNLTTIGNTVVTASKAGVPVYLRNLANVEDSFKERTSISKFNGNEVIAIVLKKEAGKNTVNVSDLATDVVNELNEKFKDKIKLHIVSDQSVFIRDSISSVASSGILAIIICYFVLLFFLGSYREPIIVISAVPISVMITFMFMYFKGITLNTMSLGGLAIGVGMVVDSATVVLESIYQKQKETSDKVQAAIEGTGDVITSVIGSTITTCIVFLPIVFVKGMAGAIFAEFALTITFSLIASLLVSITLVPVLTLFKALQTDLSKLDTNSKKNSRRLALIDKISALFENTALYFYDHKKKLLMLCIITIPVTVLLFYFIPAELMPEIDQGQFTVKIIAEEGTTLANTASLTDSVSQIITNTKDTTKVFSKIGYEERDLVINPKGDFGLNRSEIFVKLKSSTSTNDVLDKIRKDTIALEKSQHAKIVFIPAKSIIADLFSSSGSGITIEVAGQDIEGLKKICREIEEELRRNEKLTDITSSFREESPEFKVELDRDKMAFFGLTVETVATTLKSALKGEVATKFRENDFEFDVLTRLHESDRVGLDSVRELYIKNPSGKAIKVSSFSDVIESKMSRKIVRSEGKRLGMVSANYKDLKQSQVADIINPIIAKYEDTKEYSVLPGEVDKETKRSFNSLGFAALLAVVLIYMTMASLFENYILPIIVMLSIIMDGIGVAIGLLLFGHTLNIISIMGIVMLGGLVVNNAIILIEFFQAKESEFSSEKDLIVAAIRRRLNTILNTSATTILGLIPAAFAIGGPSPQAPMAVAVIGGLTVSTILTVILIPIAYVVIAKPKLKDAGFSNIVLLHPKKKK